VGSGRSTTSRTSGPPKRVICTARMQVRLGRARSRSSVGRRPRARAARLGHQTVTVVVRLDTRPRPVRQIVGRTTAGTADRSGLPPSAVRSAVGASPTPAVGDP
jgi:hypothetical protein